MVKVDEYARIRQAHRQDKLSIRQLARRFHHSRRKIREILSQPEPKKYQRRTLASVVDPFKPIIDALLRADEDAPRQQRHTIAKLFRRLQNDECQIDALPQAWAVISGAADPSRARQALAAVERRLVRPKGKLIQLFDPPFDRGVLEPGYIKGYVPGIRENGGQYTHAATWVVLATALQGRGDRALELWNLINPVYHAITPADVEHYKVEPYVVCADVYGASPHTGRGGWTWYTGSASWLYRVALEAILGLRLAGDRLRFEPCVPPSWPGYEITYRYRSATYRVRVENPTGTGRGVRSVTVDDQPVPGGIVPLRDDGRTHAVRVTLG